MNTIIANIIAIYRKELQSYFYSPLSLGIAGVYWLISGFFFLYILLGPDGILMQVAMREQLGITQPVDVPYQFLQFFLSVMGSLSLFFLPMLSMGLYAEERKRGTLELLATSPLTNWSVAIAKLLGVLTFYLTMTAPFLLYEVILFSAAEPKMPLMIPLLGQLAMILLAASILSLGMFISSLTESTFLSAILTFALILFLWVMDSIANGLPGAWGGALDHLSLLKHYSNLVQGSLNSSSIILFFSYILLGVFLTSQSIEALRYQRS